MKVVYQSIKVLGIWIIPVLAICLPGEKDFEAEIEYIDSLITASRYQEAFAMTIALESNAKSSSAHDVIHHVRFQQARIFNFTNKYAASDSVLNLLIDQKPRNPFDFDAKLLLYNNAMRLSNKDKALCILESLSEAKQGFTPVELLKYRNARADFYTIKEEYLEALRYLLLAKKELPKDIPFNSEFNLNYQLGALYNAIGVFDQAISIGIENQSLAVNNESYYLELFSIFTQIEAYERTGDDDAVNRLFERAEYLRTNHNVNTSYGFIYYVKGRCHLTKNELDSALHYFDNGIIISKELKSKKEKFENLLGKGLTHIRLGDIERAKRCLESAEKIKQYEHEDFIRLGIEISLKDEDYQGAFNNSEQLIAKLESKGRGNNSYNIISSLLTDKFDREKRETKLLTEQQEDQRNNIFTFSVLILVAGFFTLLSLMLHRNKGNLEKLNEDLKLKNEALLNYSYISSHDLKEPARNIASFTDLLINKKQNSYTGSEYNEILQIISNSSKTLLEIVKSLGIFSETALNEDIVLEDVSIREVMMDIDRNLKELIEAKDAVVNFEDHPDISTIKYSKSMLYLLLKNLIQNAIKYNNKSKAVIEVNLKAKKENYLFSVSDNGPGIREDKLDYIFKPFKTLQSKSLNQSSGLGLSICKNIVEKFRGEIWVDTKPNEGSIFYFTVPRT